MVMKYLRTVSTRRLLGIIAGFIVAIGGGTAIAVAASSNGPVPRREPLAVAIHQALSARSVPGISARVSFTNNLISSTDIQGPSDPILQGGSGRLWLSLAPGQHRLRIELQSDRGDAQLVVNDGSWWVYDPGSNTAYEGTLPAGLFRGSHDTDAAPAHAVPSVTKIQSALNRVSRHVDLSGAIPSDVAGQATYTVRLSPKHDGGLLGNAQLAWDAIRGVPLRFAIYARGSSTPVIELKATDVSYAAMPASDFAVQPPSGSKIVRLSSASIHAAAVRAGRERARARSRHESVSGVSAVVRRVPFKLVAPRALVGLPRRSVSLLDAGGKPGALLIYGQNLGGVVVLEQAAGSSAAGGGSGEHRGLNLPTVSINGTTGQELDTALGTMIRFSRGGVAYTVIGSVLPPAAEAVARSL
jgi:outer membrane lipoprotein-sorting protein